MSEKNIHVITGAFGYLGKYIARNLLDNDPNIKIRTLTGHLNRPNPFDQHVEVVPFHFDDHYKLVDDLKDVKTVYNTYWVRFSRGDISFGQAVANVQNLIRAAATAGVERFVHISITNPDLNSPFGYFKGKAVMEKTLVESGLSYAILRPTVLFGREDVLINNIAWLLRRFPIYAVFDSGEYRVQPVFVDDVAKLAIELGNKNENIICNALGPETFSFRGLVRLIQKRVHSRAKIVHVGPTTSLFLSKILNLISRDIIVTNEEVYGLMADILSTTDTPRCPTSFSQWSEKNASSLGAKYASELDRHYRIAPPSRDFELRGETRGAGHCEPPLYKANSNHSK